MDYNGNERIEWPAAKNTLRGSQKVNFVILTEGNGSRNEFKVIDSFAESFPEPKSEILRSAQDDR